MKHDLNENGKKYGNWVEKLIEPSSFNDARLFALETRVNEEEDVRFAQLETFKDILRKLLYTFEQERTQVTNLSVIDDSKNESELPALPGLHKVS